jgi:hypothetical protein
MQLPADVDLHCEQKFPIMQSFVWINKLVVASYNRVFSTQSSSAGHLNAPTFPQNIAAICSHLRLYIRKQGNSLHLNVSDVSENHVVYEMNYLNI